MTRISTVVMAHPNRTGYLGQLLSHIDGPAEPIWDQKGDVWDTRRRCLLAAFPEASAFPEATHLCVLQDDAIVCRDLVAGLERALEQIPAPAGTPTPLCLYVGRVRPYAQQIEQLVNKADKQTRWFTMRELLWGVGIVIPVELIPEMVAWGDKQSPHTPEDRRMGRFLASKGIDTWYPWPSLVDHRDEPSIIHGHRRAEGRTAHWFIGEDQSALSVDWAGKVVTLASLNRSTPPRPPARRSRERSR